jgi:hypothetical protein
MNLKHECAPTLGSAVVSGGQLAAPAILGAGTLSYRKSPEEHHVLAHCK